MMLEKIEFNYEVAENQDKRFTPNHVVYDVTIGYKGKSFSTTYQCNPKYINVELDDVIECLIFDADGYDVYDVFDFAKEFGYDNLDKAQEIYNACKKTSENLHDMFTDEELDEIREELF